MSNNDSVKLKRLNPRRQKRLVLVFSVVFVCFIYIIIQIYILTKNEKYVMKALAQQTYISRTIVGNRGKITDRNGTVLATNISNYNLILDPSVVSYYQDKLNIDVVDYISACTDFAFGITKEDIVAAYEKDPEARYVRLRKGISYEERQRYLDAVASLVDENTGKSLSGRVVGVWFEEESKRYYPYNSLCSHVLGFSSDPSTGNYGIEQYYNDLLVGTNGKSYGYYDSALNLYESVIDKKDGMKLVSTVDAAVSLIVQKHVEDYLRSYGGADNCGVIVMDPRNGEILAMQSNYSYNLNDPRSLSFKFNEEQLKEIIDNEKAGEELFKVWRNFCISDAYEPGSTFKPFTIAAALEEDLISYSSRYYCDGSETFSSGPIHCHNIYGHRELTLAESIAQSCNDALMQIGAIIGRSYFYKYQKHFLFGEYTGIDLPGETKGILIPEKGLNQTELATSSFGQSFTVSMIQLCASFCSLVNGGYYYKPHIVKQIVDENTGETINIEPEVLERTISAETSEFIKTALLLTVEDGTAKRAQVENYAVGGKTGTAQKLPRELDRYTISFIGCAPAMNPEVVVYVVIDNGYDEERRTLAGETAELASKIMEEILPILGIYPESGEIDYHLEKVSARIKNGEEDNFGYEDSPYDELGNLIYEVDVFRDQQNESEVQQNER